MSLVLVRQTFVRGGFLGKYNSPLIFRDPIQLLAIRIPIHLLAIRIPIHLLAIRIPIQQVSKFKLLIRRKLLISSVLLWIPILHQIPFI